MYWNGFVYFMFLLCSAAKKQYYVSQNYVAQVNVFVVAAYFPENLIWGSYNCINYSVAVLFYLSNLKLSTFLIVICVFTKTI